MRKIIRKKAYDTERSRPVCFWIDESGFALYQRPTGEYFTWNAWDDRLWRFRAQDCEGRKCDRCPAWDNCWQETARLFASFRLSDREFAKEFGEAGDEG